MRMRRRGSVLTDREAGVRVHGLDYLHALSGRGAPPYCHITGLQMSLLNSNKNSNIFNKIVRPVQY